MNATVRKHRVGTMPHGSGGGHQAAVHIPGRPVLDPMNRFDVDEGRLAEKGTENPYFGESDPGRLPHLRETMHVAQTRRWIIASSLVWLVTMALGFALIPISQGMAAGALAVAILLYGLAWIFRMFLGRDARRTLLLALVVGLQVLLAVAVGLLLVAG